MPPHASHQHSVSVLLFMCISYAQKLLWTATSRIFPNTHLSHEVIFTREKPVCSVSIARIPSREADGTFQGFAHRCVQHVGWDELRW